MAYDYDRTHRNILESARRQFTTVGFRDASIRTICKEAGVTNGAFYAHFESKEDLFDKLVDPCINGFYSLYNEESDVFLSPDTAQGMAEVLKSTFASVNKLIHYMYSNKDDFNLILEAGTGTKYENFTRDLINAETEGTLVFLEKCRPFMTRPENFSRSISEFISSFTIGTVFSGFLNGDSEEDTTQRAVLAGEFCIAGLAKVLGIPWE